MGAAPLLGVEEAASDPFRYVGTGILLMLIYAVVGAFVLLISFKLFDKAITKIELEKEIEKGNVAAGIFSASIILGIAAVIAAAIAG